MQKLPFLLLLCLGSCGSEALYSRAPIKGPPTDQWVAPRITESGIRQIEPSPAEAAKPGSLTHLSKDYSREWEVIQAGQDVPLAPPAFGVALSGGGTRSASYSIGILKALHELDRLDQIDILSTVSGGSYAGHWYFSQHYHMDKVARKWPGYAYTRDDLFRTPPHGKAGEKRVPGDRCQIRDLPQYRFQRHLEDRSDILARSVTPALQFADYTSKVISFVPSIFLSTFTEFVFNWDLNVNPIRRYYEHGLERTYGFVPMRKILRPCRIDEQTGGTSQTFANQQWILFPRAQAADIQFDEMGKWVESQRNQYAKDPAKRKHRNFPFWVINTTAELKLRKPDRVRDHQGGDTQSVVGEGESRVKDNEHQRMGFGRYASTNLGDTVFEFTPYQYGSNHYDWEKDTPPIHVARAVSISGAAVDRNSVPGPVGIAMDVLNLDIGYNIRNPSPEVSSAERLLQRTLPFPAYMLFDFNHDKHHHSIHLGDGGQSEILGAYALIRRGVKKILIIDAAHDPGAEMDGLRQLARRLERFDNLMLEIDEKVPMRYDPFDAKQAIFTGTISNFPFRDETSPDGRYVVQFVYVKLSVDRNDVRIQCNKGNDQQGENGFCAIEAFMESLQHKDRFPHHSTADIFYNKEQVIAYRNLGHLNVCELRGALDQLLGTQKPNREDLDQMCSQVRMQRTADRSQSTSEH